MNEWNHMSRIYYYLSFNWVLFVPPLEGPQSQSSFYAVDDYL